MSTRTSSFGNVLTEAQLRLGLSIRQMARLIGCTEQDLSKWMRDIEVPMNKVLHLLRRISTECGVEYEMLLQKRNEGATRIWLANRTPPKPPLTLPLPKIGTIRFWEFLVDWLDREGLRPVQAAAKIGRSGATVQGWKMGHTLPSYELDIVMPKLARVLLPSVPFDEALDYLLRLRDYEAPGFRNRPLIKELRADRYREPGTVVEFEQTTPNQKRQFVADYRALLGTCHDYEIYDRLTEKWDVDRHTVKLRLQGLRVYGWMEGEPRGRKYDKCPYDHPYSEDNRYYYPNGSGRYDCLTCRERMRIETGIYQQRGGRYFAIVVVRSKRDVLRDGGKRKQLNQTFDTVEEARAWRQEMIVKYQQKRGMLTGPIHYQPVADLVATGIKESVAIREVAARLGVSDGAVHGAYYRHKARASEAHGNGKLEDPWAECADRIRQLIDVLSEPL